MAFPGRAWAPSPRLSLAAVTWEADATYRWLGVSVAIGEGVTWPVEPRTPRQRWSALTCGPPPHAGHSAAWQQPCSCLLNGETHPNRGVAARESPPFIA